MHINEIKQSKYLTKNDVGNGLDVTIRAIDQADLAMEGEPPEMKYVLHFQENIKPMVLNTTNAQLIAAVLGSEETDDWIGKRVCLYDEKTVMYAGKLVGGIRVRAANHAPKQAVAVSAPAVVATDKTRVWALNQLLGGPGQANREIVTAYLRAHALIKPNEEPEAWILSAVPTSKPGVATLSSAIEEWSRNQDDVPF